MAQQVKLQLGMPASHIRVPVQVLSAPHLIQRPASVPERQRRMAQMLGPLLPMSETPLEFRITGFSLTQSWLLWTFNLGSKPEDE